MRSAAGDRRQHPPDAVIEAYGQGRLSLEEAARLEEHFAACEQCGERLGRVAADTYCDLLRDSGPGVTDAPATRLLPTPGDGLDGLPAELRSHPRYEVRGRVGVGGMGVVYQAVHRVMNREVALKVIRPDLLATPVAVSRFRREVQTAARLSHPNIVTAFDAEEVGGAHFLVMEFVDGVSLEALVRRRGPLPPREACGLVRQAAAGLEHAHAQGMIHRDVKPGNLMVTSAGVVKILDFGLACWSGPQLAAASPGLTQLGARLGTVAYAAPEQLRSAAGVDARADQYGLGATLYHLLASKHPPPAGPGRPPRRMPLELPEALPPGLRQVVERMMALVPEDRFASAAAASEALRPWCQPPAPPPAPPARARRRRGPSRRAMLLGVVGIGVAGAALAGGAAWWAWGRRPGGEDRAPVPAPAGGAPRRRAVLFLLPGSGLWYEDYQPARDALERAGLEVVTATPTGRPSELHQASLRGRPGRPAAVPADTDLAGVAHREASAVVCVGYLHQDLTAPGTPTAARVAALLRRAAQSENWLVGICAGQQVLGAAGLLRGRRVAQQGEHSGDLAALGASPQAGQGVVVDRRLITASSPADAAGAAAELVRRLGAAPTGRD